jgi:flagellar assembly protein FliH
MISPSDAGMNLDAVLAGNMLKDEWRKGSVHPLEFEAIDHPLRRKSDWVLSHEDDHDVVAKQLREEMATLDSRMRAQTQRIEVQLVEATQLAKLEGRQEWQAELDEVIAGEREQIVLACSEFAKQRADYFASVESEVVRLALAIAARVLHREAKLDPLLLGAVVRVALEKVADDSSTVLHVPLAQVEAWHALLATSTGMKIEVVGEEKMEATGCVLETQVGRIELGVSEQLGEIEKGFFDLLQQRPA